jgi:hypothetical protein
LQVGEVAGALPDGRESVDAVRPDPFLPLRKRDPERARTAISQDILIGGKTLLDKLKP